MPDAVLHEECRAQLVSATLARRIPLSAGPAQTPSVPGHDLHLPGRPQGKNEAGGGERGSRWEGRPLQKDSCLVTGTTKPLVGQEGHSLRVGRPRWDRQPPPPRIRDTPGAHFSFSGLQPRAACGEALQGPLPKGDRDISGASEAVWPRLSPAHWSRGDVPKDHMCLWQTVARAGVTFMLFRGRIFLHLFFSYSRHLIFSCISFKYAAR